MTGLFDEGAGDLDSEAFQIRLDDAGAEMRFDAGRDGIYGSMRMLAEQQGRGVRPAAAGGQQAALRPGADRPHPRADPVRHHRQASTIPKRWRRPNGREALYGDHPYSRPDEGTKKSIATITPDDLRAFHKAMFARGGLHVAVVGAIDAETLKRELDMLFGDLPEKPGADARRR